MKRLTILALACATSLTALPGANAGSFQDYDSFFNASSGAGTTVNSGSPINSKFDFRTGGDPADLVSGIEVLGYNPATESITGFDLAFQVSTTATTPQGGSINLDGVALTILPFTGSYTFGGTLAPAEATAILAAAQDGTLPYTISTTGGNSFQVNYAFMKVTTVGRAVPDFGSTLALLGAAFGSLGLLRRKFSC